MDGRRFLQQLAEPSEELLKDLELVDGFSVADRLRADGLNRSGINLLQLHQKLHQFLVDFGLLESGDIFELDDHLGGGDIVGGLPLGMVAETAHLLLFHSKTIIAGSMAIGK